MTAQDTVVLGEGWLTLEALQRAASGRAAVRLADSVAERMGASAAVLQRAHESDEAIYGVTTSVGASVVTAVPPELASALSLNVVRMHGCGTGPHLGRDETAAVMIARLASLAQGKSGVRFDLAERIALLLSAGVVPCMPAEGSVGASGDLTPLSYLAALLVGEREALVDGRVVAAKDALTAIGVEPLVLAPKEALALMNGTSMSTALAALLWCRARRVTRLSCSITAMVSRALRGNSEHFDALVHAVKVHPGQSLAAAWIRADLDADQSAARLQDRYSVRCVPHIAGAAVDALVWSGTLIERELNSVSDNPIVDTASGRIVHGGNFYAGHVAMACDTLKVAVAHLACMLDRQLMLLCNEDENDGLPANLSGVQGAARCAHNGFKAMTIAASSLAAETLKLTMPASAFGRSTELHNQDKVPMAPLATRDLARIVELTETVSVMVLLAAVQALDLRAAASSQATQRAPHATGAGHGALYNAVRTVVPRLEADRRMDVDIEAALGLLRGDVLPLDIRGLRLDEQATQADGACP